MRVLQPVRLAVYLTLAIPHFVLMVLLFFALEGRDGVCDVVAFHRRQLSKVRV